MCTFLIFYVCTISGFYRKGEVGGGGEKTFFTKEAITDVLK